MWICLNDGFVSAVEREPGSAWLKVRARKRSHLTALFGREIRIKSDQKSDYRFRTFVTKAHFARVLASRVEAIDYGNFKDSVSDPKLHDLYKHFWFLHRRYQDAPNRYVPLEDRRFF